MNHLALVQSAIIDEREILLAMLELDKPPKRATMRRH